MTEGVDKPTSDVNSPKWWAERGVADEVRAARPYVRWTTENTEPVRDAYAELSEGQRGTLLGWARQSDGLVIYRHSFERVPPGELRYVYPEIRPDERVDGFAAARAGEEEEQAPGSDGTHQNSILMPAVSMKGTWSIWRSVKRSSAKRFLRSYTFTMPA